MAQKKSEFVSGFDIAARVFKSLANAVMDEGGGDEDVRRIETDGNLRKQIAELVMRDRKLADNAVRLFVDYTRPLAEMIKGCGFDCVNSDITEKNFPIAKRPNGEVEMKLFHFNQTMESDEVIREMDKEGYRPAELPEGLAYAKANPNEQRKNPIVILGSVWRDWHGDRLVPYLREWPGDRKLSLNWYGIGWRERCRFLAVRK